jgi:hypothetical protein
MESNGNAGQIKPRRNKRISHENIDNKLNMGFCHSAIQKVEENPYMTAIKGGEPQKHQKIKFY